MSYRAAGAEMSPYEQNDDRSDDGANDARGLEEAVLSVLVEEQVAEESADE